MYIRYHELGYNVLPVEVLSKKTYLSEWTKWCYEKQPLELVEQFEKTHPLSEGYGIGIILGKASNLLCLDVDHKVQEIISKIPSSPVIRIGNTDRHGALFFQYNKDITTIKFDHGKDIYGKSINETGVYQDGRFMVIPPSVHPDTKKPYFWATNDTLLNYPNKDLPIFTLSDLISLSEMYPKSDSGRTSSGGRNDSLRSIVQSMRYRGEIESVIVNEVYNVDIEKHAKRLFTDSDEGYKALNESDAKNNAWKFVNSITKTMILRGEIKLENEKPVIIVSDDSTGLEQYEEKAFPEPTGLVKDIRDLIIEFSERVMPNIALGASIFLVNLISCNRFRFMDCWANNYILNLAPTGSGKSYPQRMIYKILDEELNTGLLRGGSHSGSAFVKDLLIKREQGHIIDECAADFQLMKDGGVYQMKMLDDRCNVWSASSGMYSATSYADKDDTSSCYNPCINILGSSTPDGIKQHITKMMVTKGLIPRFLIFKDEIYGKPSLDRFNHSLFKSVVEQVKIILDVEKREKYGKKDLLHGPIYDPIDLQPTKKDAIEYFSSIRSEFFYRIESEPTELGKHMLSRGKEHIMKLAISRCIGEHRRVIDINDLMYAKKTFEVSLHNSASFIEESAVDSEWEKDVNHVLNFFKKKKFITEASIIRRIPRLQSIRIRQILSHLISAEKITQASSESGKGRKFDGFTLVSND